MVPTRDSKIVEILHEILINRKNPRLAAPSGAPVAGLSVSHYASVDNRLRKDRKKVEVVNERSFTFTCGTGSQVGDVELRG